MHMSDNAKKEKKAEIRAKQRLSFAKAITWSMLATGLVALIASIIINSSILAFLGLGLTFWGAILLYVKSQEYTRKIFLDASVLPSLYTLNQLFEELDYKGTPIYLPPNYFKIPESTKIYIPKQKKAELPKPEDIQKYEEHLFVKNPQGILLIPPGIELTKLFEMNLKTSFIQIDLEYLYQNLPKLLIEDLEIAENIEIETKYNKIKIRITNSIFKESHRENNKLSHLYPSIGCPLSSAIACALTKATGKPITIENIQPSEDGKIIEATYRILGKIETETILPETKPKELTEELLTEPIQLQIRKRFLPNLASLLLTAIGSILLAEVAWITFYDTTIWGKDIAVIFLGSRTGEAISLGIGLKIVHYFLIGLVLLLSGLVTYLRRRSKV